MSKKNGWVPIDKNLVYFLSNINRPYSHVEAMFSFTVDQNNGVEWSISGYAKQWEWSRNKVRRFIKNILLDEGHPRDTPKDTQGTPKGHPIHFIDKGLWMAKDTQGTPKGHPKGQGKVHYCNPNPLNPNPKEKILPKKTLVKEKPLSFSKKHENDVVAVFDYWKEKLNHPRSKLDMKRKKLILARMKEGYMAEELKEAIKGCKRSAFHQGENDRKAIYDSIGLIMRDADSVDKFIGYLSAEPEISSMRGKWIK